MFFILKKTLGWLALPFNLTLFLCACGAFVFWQRRWPHLRRSIAVPCLAAAAVLFLFFGNAGISNSLISSLENNYPAIPEINGSQQPPTALADCKYVLVLGAGAHYHPDRASVSRLSLFSLPRLAEGIRIFRALPPDAKLVVTGWDGGTAREGVLAMACEYERAAISLGVPKERIIRIETARDTRDEITQTKRRAGEARVALVTTAFHMPRAMQLCAETGLDATPCPTGFSTAETHWFDFLKWSPWALAQSGVWVHEFLGKLFA